MSILLMKPPKLPICCRADSFAELAAAMTSEKVDVLRVAVSCASQLFPGIHHWAIANQQIGKMADTIHSRVRGKQPQALFANLHGLIFDEMGFQSVLPANKIELAVISRAMELKCATPMLMALIYIRVAERLGVKCTPYLLTSAVRGDGMVNPTILISASYNGETMVVNPSEGGRIWTKPEWDKVLTIDSNIEEWDEMNPRAWCAFILRDLLYLSMANKDDWGASAILELQTLVAPEHISLWRDLGLMLARMKEHRASAAICLRHWISVTPQPDSMDEDIHELITMLEGK